MWYPVVWPGYFLSTQLFEFVVLLAIRVVEDANPVVGCEPDPASIERPVMESAECDAIPDIVTTVLAPWIDMRGFDFRCSIRCSSVCTTDSTGLIVGFEDEFPKGPIACASLDCGVFGLILSELWFRFEGGFQRGLLAFDLGSVSLEQHSLERAMLRAASLDAIVTDTLKAIATWRLSYSKLSQTCLMLSAVFL